MPQEIEEMYLGKTVTFQEEDTDYEAVVIQVESDGTLVVETTDGEEISIPPEMIELIDIVNQEDSHSEPEPEEPVLTATAIRKMNKNQLKALAREHKIKVKMAISSNVAIFRDFLCQELTGQASPEPEPEATPKKKPTVPKKTVSKKAPPAPSKKVVPVPEPKPDPDPDPPEEKKDFDLQIETPNDRGKSKMQIVAELLREGGSENEMVTRLNQSHPKSPEANRRDIQKYAKFLEYMGLIDTDIKTTYKVR